MGKRWAGWLAVAAGGVLAGACGGCLSPPAPTPIADDDAAPPFEMRLMAGDEVEINFFGAPDLNITQRIRRDGRITLRLNDDLRAEGKTVTELQGDLVSRYRGQIQIQAINVIVRSGPAVIVSGAVHKPGRVEITRPMTALDAIMAAEGFDPDKAEMRSVIVIRHGGPRYKGYCLDLQPALRGEGGRAFYVRPNDIVYVPQTRVVAVNRWVDQHINRMLPRLGIGYDSEGNVQVYR